MKLRIFLFLFSLIFICQALPAQDVSLTNHAIAYNDLIIEEQNSIALRIMKVMDHITIPNEPEAQKALKEFKEQAEMAVRNVERMGEFEGNNELLEASMNLFEFYSRVASEHYPKVLKVMFSENPSTEEQKEMNTVLQTMGIEEQEMDKTFKEAQTNFAAQFDFSLGKNELQED